MSDALIFTLVFVGFVVIRLVAATIFFYVMLPDDGRCPNCDTPTIRVQSKGWNLLFPWFRTSWCYNCQWEGMLRNVVASSDSGARLPDDSHRNVKA